MRVQTTTEICPKHSIFRRRCSGIQNEFEFFLVNLVVVAWPINQFESNPKPGLIPNQEPGSRDKILSGRMRVRFYLVALNNLKHNHVIDDDVYYQRIAPELLLQSTVVDF